MSDIENPVIPLTPNETISRDFFKEKLGISKKAVIAILLMTIFGASLITVSNIKKVLLSTTIKALLTILGVIFCTPILYLFFRLYHYFIPPLFPAFENSEDEALAS